MFTNKIIFTDPTSVERTFYEAIGARNLTQLMSVWADEDDILCVLPTGEMAQGYTHIERMWARIFSAPLAKFSMNVQVRQRLDGVMMAFHHVIEDISMVKDNNTEKGLVGAVNIFSRTPEGWRLYLHQATGLPPPTLRESTRLANAEDEKLANAPSPSRLIH